MEYVLWGLPKGKTDTLHEQVLLSEARIMKRVEAIKLLAAKDGWHSFRVQVIDGSPIDWRKTVDLSDLGIA